LPEGRLVSSGLAACAEIFKRTEYVNYFKAGGYDGD